MNYQQSYPGVWLGGLPPLKPAEPADPEQVLADLEDEQEREREWLIDDARYRANGGYDD